MSTVELSALIDDVRKKMGKIVYSKWRGINYARRYSKPTGESTVKQQTIRNAFKKLVKDWVQMNGIMHRSWDEYCENRNLTGYNAFIGVNAISQRNGQAIELFRKLGIEPLANFIASPGSAAGEINCSFLRTEDIAGRHLTLFVQKRVNGLGEGRFIRFDGGVDTPSPFVINGLEGGQEYFVYACLTDAAYPQATMVSISVSSTCVAAS